MSTRARRPSGLHHSCCWLRCARRHWLAGLSALVGGLIGTAEFHGAHLAFGLRLVPGDELDARFVAFVAEHLYVAAREGRSLLSPPVFHPETRVLAYSDVHLLTAIPHAAFRGLRLTVLQSTAAAIVVLTLATCIATYAFLHVGMGFGPVSAAVGAYVFTFSSPKLNQMSHLQHQVLLLLIPAMAWALVRFVEAAAAGVERRAWTSLLLAALLFHLQLWTSFQIAWVWALQVAVAVVIALLRRESRRAAAAWSSTHAGPLACLALAMRPPSYRSPCCTAGRPWSTGGVAGRRSFLRYPC